MALDTVIGKEIYGKKVHLLIEERSGEVRIALLPEDGTKQQLIYITNDEFAEICEKFLEDK